MGRKIYVPTVSDREKKIMQKEYYCAEKENLSTKRPRASINKIPECNEVLLPKTFLPDTGLILYHANFLEEFEISVYGSAVVVGKDSEYGNLATVAIRNFMVWHPVGCLLAEVLRNTMLSVAIGCCDVNAIRRMSRGDRFRLKLRPDWNYWVCKDNSQEFVILFELLGFAN
jgi:hypothetical protein